MSDMVSENNPPKLKDKTKKDEKEEEKEFKFSTKSKFSTKQRSITQEEEETNFKNPFENNEDKTNTDDPFAPNPALRIGGSGKWLYKLHSFKIHEYQGSI